MADINRIQITEEDLTTGITAESEIDVAYIPGFFYREPESGEEPIEFLDPILFTSVDEFESRIGKASIFNEDITCTFTEGSKKIISSGIMDPSYVMAKELLYMGLPVVYEGLINSYPNYIKGNQTTYDSYQYDLYTKADSIYTSVYTAVTSATSYAANTFYEKDITGKYTLLTGSQPADWPTSGTSTKYFSKAAYNASTEYYYNNSDPANDHGIINESKFSTFYTKLITSLTTLQDLGISNIKYITSGGYPVFNLTTTTGNNKVTEAMIACAKNRGDAFALLDTYDDAARTVVNTNSASLYYAVNTYFGANPGNADYAAFIYPHGIYALYANYDLTEVQAAANANYVLPGSFAYLISLAQSLKNNPAWYAIAGVARGLVPHLRELHLDNKLTNKIADSYQPFSYSAEDGREVSVNAITNIREYGLCIWGNRTLKSIKEKKVLTATSFLNLRNLICNVKKVAYTAAQKCLFEQNSEILWLNFKSMITPTLDGMQTSSGLSGYKLARVALTATEQANNRGLVKAKIILYPVYAVERFEISITISDTQVEVE